MQPNDSSLDSNKSLQTSKKIVLPVHPFVLVMIVVSVVALTALVMYSLSYESKISRDPLIIDKGQVSEQPPVPVVELPPVEPIVYNKESMALKVQWMTPERIQNGFQVTGFGRDTAVVPSSDLVGYGLDHYHGRYYKVGVIQEGNATIAAGSPVYTVILQCSGLCFAPSLYRIVVSNNVPYLLGKHSSVYDDSTLLYESLTRISVLSEAEIPDLAPRQRIEIPGKGSLQKIGAISSMFDAARFTSSIDVAGVGKVYYGEHLDSKYLENIPEEDRPYVGYYGSVNAFGLVLPDSTLDYYSLVIPFINEKTSVPDVVWNDGSKNSTAFSSVSLGGCGATNAITVIGPDVVNPSKDLVQAGTAANGDKIYFLKDSQHALMKEKYDSYGNYDEKTQQITKVPYAQFVAAHPMFFWVDPFGRLIQFQNMTFAPMAECGKPVIYLYPERETEVSVKVRLQNGMTVSDPEYNDGWNVVAKPDGSMVNKADGASYPYLFWEGRGMYYETPEAGWMVQREHVPGFLKEKLGAMGLNETEIRDFMEFWVPLMQEKPWYFVTFAGTESMNSIAPLTISPKPDTVFRILMDYEPLDAPREVREPQRLPRVIRRGFTVVEWGGVLGR